MRAWLLLPVTLLTACAAERAKEKVRVADEKAAEEMNDAASEAQELMVSPRCRVAWANQCGLIAAEVEKPEFLKRFVENVCGFEPQQPDEPVPAECMGRFARMFVARLQDRYWAANFAKVQTWCEGYPEKCDNAALEMKLLNSHNARVAADYQRRIAEVGARRDRVVEEIKREARQQDAATGQAFAAFGAALQGRPVIRCTSTAAGNTVSTTCQ